MVIVSPLSVGLFPFQMALTWLIHGGDPKYLYTPTGILRVGGLRLRNQFPWKVTQLLVSSDGGYLVTAAADTNVHVYNMADPCQSGFFCSPKNETRMDGEEHDDKHGDDAG